MSFNTYSLHTYTRNIFNNTDTWWQKWTRYTTYMHAHTHKNTQTTHIQKAHKEKKHTCQKNASRSNITKKRTNIHTKQTHNTQNKNRHTKLTHENTCTHTWNTKKKGTHANKCMNRSTQCAHACTHTPVYTQKKSQYVPGCKRDDQEENTVTFWQRKTPVTPCSRVLLQKLKFVQIVKILPTLYGMWCFISEPTSGSNPEPHEPSPHPHIPSLLAEFQYYLPIYASVPSNFLSKILYAFLITSLL